MHDYSSAAGEKWAHLLLLNLLMLQARPFLVEVPRRLGHELRDVRVDQVSLQVGRDTGRSGRNSTSARRGEKDGAARGHAHPHLAQVGGNQLCEPPPAPSSSCGRTGRVCQPSEFDICSVGVRLLWACQPVRGCLFHVSVLFTHLYVSITAYFVSHTRLLVPLFPAHSCPTAASLFHLPTLVDLLK